MPVSTEHLDDLKGILREIEDQRDTNLINSRFLYFVFQNEMRVLRADGDGQAVEELNHYRRTLQRRPNEAVSDAGTLIDPSDSLDIPTYFYSHLLNTDLHHAVDPEAAERNAQALLGLRRPVHLFGYRFFAVGQGLFTAGYVSRRRAPPFRWVYDCGSATKIALVRNGLADLRRAIGGTGRGHLDLVVISHFDADHVNGLIDLLKQFSVGTILLPYLRPDQRLEALRAERAPVGSDQFGFITAPAAFILGRDGAEVSTILLVPSGRGEGPPPPDGTPEEAPPPEGGGDLQYPEGELPTEDDAEAGALASGKVRMLAKGGALTLPHVWEFVPYNDAEFSDRADPGFQKVANKGLCLLKRTANAGKWDRCRKVLAYLNGLYDGRFGPGGRPRNISLFLYSGAVEKAELTAIYEYHPALPLWGREDLLSSNRFGQLFTGDGYLNTDQRLTALQTYFRPSNRLARAGMFQVMHHGSRANWYAGVAPTLAPAASLFSSERSRSPYHPHDEVWAAFAPYHRRQIDSANGWSLGGAFVVR